MDKKGNIYVVQCIDTEGPLDETLLATFQRIKGLTGLTVEPTKENLEKIQNKQYPLNGYEDVAAIAFSKRLLGYNHDYHDLTSMLDKVTSPEFRLKFADSDGNGWVYSWFIVDLADYVTNPRRRDIGYGNVLDYYNEYYELHKKNHDERDEIQFHAHPMSVYHECNRCGDSYINSPHIIEGLCRRLIEKADFSRGFRAGFHTERPDSHWFLEQYIPYDFTNESVELTELDKKQSDLSGGRFGDWRRAVSDWSPYHPAHDDYQIQGNCNRTIFRCLNVGTRVRLLTQDEVYKAFARADNGEDTILAFCDHDFRNFIPDIEEVYNMVLKAHEKYPEVKWHNAGACAAADIIMKQPKTPINIEVKLEGNNKSKKLTVTSNIDTFGPQPFFAIKLKSGRYILENLDIQEPRRRWTYIFDADSAHADDIDKIGIASNSLVGSGALKVIDGEGVLLAQKQW